MPETTCLEERPWHFTVVRAHGLQKLRTEKSWRPIVVVTVGSHQAHELNLGCDGQNPNLKQCFRFHDADASSRIDICVYHLASSKKKSKRRNLVANVCCTLQDLARLQAQQQCRQKSVEIKLNGVVSRQKGALNKSKPTPIILVAKLDLPEVYKEPSYVREGVETDVFSEGPDDHGYASSSTPESSEGPAFVWPEEPEDHIEPKVHTGYWSNSEDTLSENERNPLLKHRDDGPILAPSRRGSKDSLSVKHTDSEVWFAASILPAHTETISIKSQISTIDSVVDSFSPYRQLREACVDSEYERILAELCAEWRFVGGSLVALAGLEAGAFGLSSGSAFIENTFARRAIAVGSVASGIGLTIDVWFLLAYHNANPTNFQKMALDVYGKYLFFCISARIPALCLFTSAVALMAFLLSVAWSTWPTAVLIMSFITGVLISLQFIVYGMHCIVVIIAEAVRGIRSGILRCVARIRPPPPDVRENHVT